MELSIPHAVINASVNIKHGQTWYPHGTKRLEKSLNYHGDTADFLSWENHWPTPGYNEKNPYCIKPSCMEKAVEMGYRRLLWLDCSVYVIRSTMPVWDEINHYGYYFWRSGFNCAQTCTDKSLEYFCTTRDEAETWQDCSTSVIGINLDNPDGAEFFRRWTQAAKDGIFDTSRYHDKQSKDPRFLHGRQDQECASIIINQMGLAMRDPGYLSAVYDHKDMPETVVTVMMGL